MTALASTPRATFTHTIPATAPCVGAALYRTFCGRLIHGATHSATPTCPDCRRILDEDELIIEALRLEFPDLNF